MKKIILTLAAFCFLFLDAAGQEIEWQNTIGGDNIDGLFSIIQTSDGGYILGGSSKSNISGDKTENCQGLDDYWIVKTDSLGNIQWQNTIGGNDNDNLYSIQQTFDGGYILGGHSMSYISGDKTENNVGGQDLWIIKTDASGNIQWQNTIGGSDFEWLYSIHQTTDGGYIIGGYSYSNISGDKTENSNGGSDCWIVKTDASGNIQWQNTIGGSDEDWLYSMQQTADGGYILGTNSSSNISGDKTENNRDTTLNTFDYWIVKIDVSGNIQWEKTIGGSHDERLRTIHQTSDEGYIIGGYSKSNISGDKTENNLDSNLLTNDYWIVKTDSSGNIQWQNTIGGKNNDLLISSQQIADGGYIFGGYSYSNVSGDKTENSNGSSDCWIIKTDSSGNIQWQNTIGGSDLDGGTSIQQTADGGFILGGASPSNISGDKSENCIGGNDYWIIKLTGKYNSITGKVFIDFNSNSLQDSLEPDLSYNKITEQSSGKFTFSEQNGHYSVTVSDTGNFTVTPSSLNYYSEVPAFHSAYFNGMFQTDSLNDFALQPAGVFNDLCVSFSPLSIFRAGFDALYMISYENVGTTALNGTVIFFPDSNITFVSANPSPTIVTIDSIVWNLGLLTPFQSGNISVKVHINSGVAGGTLIYSSVRIEPVASDANTACNYDEWGVFVAGPVDPNAILVDRDTVLTTELSSPPYLNYIIYFQNTGNDTAFNARVLNNIPQMLDVNSFEFVASSHPVNITYGAHARLMTFTFDNILLPDSNVNEPASHGFIRYRVKPLDTLVPGNKIYNRAFIYFDFNQPVETNYAITEIVLPTGIPIFNFQFSIFNLFPNPARKELTISSDLLTGKNTEVKIYDLFGREVFQLQTSNLKPQTKINVAGFSQGVYLIQLTSGEKTARAKFVKQ